MFLAKSEKDKDLLLHRVTKHGSHDQKTHGRKGGKGGSGGGSAGGSSAGGAANQDQEKLGNETSDKMYDATLSFVDELDGLRERANTNKQIKTLNEATNTVQQATKDFMDAKKLTGKAKIRKIQSGVNKYESAMNRISGLEIDRMNVDQTIQNALDGMPESLRELGVDTMMDI